VGGGCIDDGGVGDGRLWVSCDVSVDWLQCDMCMVWCSSF
jgi:hypothetical protein